MKRSIYQISISLHALLILVSCVKTIDFKNDIINPKITINGIIEPDKLISVYVSKSCSNQDGSDVRDKIDNTTAKLFENDQLIETLKSKIATNPNPFYYSKLNKELIFYSETVKPQPGKTYRIEVSLPTLPNASGTTTIPSKVEISKIDTVTTTSSNSDGYIESSLTVYATFKDIPNEKTYYKLNVYSLSGRNPTKYSQNKNKDTVYLSTQKIYADFSKEPLLTPQGESTDIFDFSSSNQQNIFTDELISNKEHTLKFMIPFYKFSDQQIDTTLNEFVKLIIELETIHSDYYKYIQASELQSESDGSPFSEPVQVFTNINNGLGIFSSKEISSKSFLIGKYPVEGVTYTKNDPYNPYNQ